MNPRNLKPASVRAPVAPIHRGPQAAAPAAPTAYGAAFVHAPNAALLIDFDNVTMGIRSDLGKELRTLLSSDIIKGKVAVQRAYADWRRYPQYIVPLTEASIDLIYAPAYGSSKKNATDIRLAIDALELIFTRPEIGTFILLSGDSDFSSLVIKLKEYGKYVIGVGIRESSSDLLVMNCDEYYSYNALAGLMKAGEEEKISRDPWELVVEAVGRMRRNGDVMRSDRLKQVMQEIDDTFDEKNLGMAKFSRFVQEAAQRGLVKVTRMENGQMEVDAVERGAARAGEEEVEGAAPAAPRAAAPAREEREAGEEPRRGRRGRGRRGGRERGEREERGERRAAEPPAHFAPPLAEPVTAVEEMRGERLTREEALDLVRRAVQALTAGSDEPIPANIVRRKARELLARDSESLNERFFHRILRDAHDANLLDLRKRGDDYEVAAAAAAPIAEQLAAGAAPAAMAGGEEEPSQAGRAAATAASLRRGIRHRGIRTSRPTELPPGLLALGVVAAHGGAAPPAPAAPVAPPLEREVEVAEEAVAGAKKPARRGTRGRGRGAAAKGGAAKAASPRKPKAAKGAAASDGAGAPAEVAKPRRPRAKKAAAAEPAE